MSLVTVTALTKSLQCRAKPDLTARVAGLIAVLVSVPWPAGAYALPLQTPGDRADSLREASERLSRIHVENHLAIGSYVRDSARMPDDELRRIEAQSARWLAQPRREARSGMWGEFAALMTAPGSFPDLADMRLRIDESEALVKGVIESLDEAIKANPGENAAVFYLEAAAIATEAANQGVPLSIARESNYAVDVRRLMQAGSACSWCDFSTAKDAGASIAPAYAPGLSLCIEYIADSMERRLDDRPEVQRALALLAVRASRHLADDATLASAALSMRLL